METISPSFLLPQTFVIPDIRHQHETPHRADPDPVRRKLLPCLSPCRKDTSLNKSCHRPDQMASEAIFPGTEDMSPRAFTSAKKARAELPPRRLANPNASRHKRAENLKCADPAELFGMIILIEKAPPPRSHSWQGPSQRISILRALFDICEFRYYTFKITYQLKVAQIHAAISSAYG